MAGIAGGIISALIAAYGIYQQSQAQAQAQEYNSKVAENNARIQRNNAVLAQQQAEQSAIQQQRKNDLLMAHQRSALAAGGVTLDAGSPLLVIADSQRQSALDVANVRYAGTLRAYGLHAEATNLEAQAGLDRYMAGTYRTSGYTRATGTLLSGATRAFEKSRGTNQPYDPGNANQLY